MLYACENNAGAIFPNNSYYIHHFRNIYKGQWVISIHQPQAQTIFTILNIYIGVPQPALKPHVLTLFTSFTISQLSLGVPYILRIPATVPNNFHLFTIFLPFSTVVHCSHLILKPKPLLKFSLHKTEIHPHPP